MKARLDQIYDDMRLLLKRMNYATFLAQVEALRTDKDNLKNIASSALMLTEELSQVIGEFRKIISEAELP